MIKVCHISTLHEISDDRIYYKQCQSLANAGFDVTFLGQKASVSIDSKNVHIQTFRLRSRYIARFLNSFILSIFRALLIRAKIYHFHDPELIIMGHILKCFGKIVIYDVHELVAMQIQDKARLGNRVFRNIMQRIYILFERSAVNRFDKIILAEKGYLEYYANNYPGHPDKIDYIQNFAILSIIDKVEPVSYDDQIPTIIYIGGLTRIRGIKELVQSIQLIEGSVKLQLLGKWESDIFRDECMKQDFQQKVEYLGFKKLEDVYSFVKAADVGVAFIYPLENFMTSLPVKSFEYMASSLPMVLSNFPLWQDHFQECALFADPHDPMDIARKLTELLEDPGLQKRLGANGRTLVEKHYSWEYESQRLNDIYEELIH